MRRNPLKDVFLDGYYHLARTTVLRHIHNYLRLSHHRLRYGVNNAFMFRNVEIEINSMCNRKCSYCPNSFARRPGGYMTEWLFYKIIDELAEMDFDGTISYHFYGEPLLDRRLPAFLKRTVKKVPKCRPVIYSNGDFLSLEGLREYIKAGVFIFVITQHDNSMPANLDRIIKEASEQEIRHIAIRFANQIAMGNRAGLIASAKTPSEPLCAPCDWPLSTIVIMMDGNVVPCCNDYFETEVVGNVAADSLRSVWCSQRFEQFRTALSRGDRTISSLCAHCDSVPERSQLARIVLP